MLFNINGWMIPLVYVVLIAVAVVGLYFLVRGAVLSALTSHTHWVDDGRP